MVNKEYFEGNIRYYQYVDCENMQLLGKVDATKFEDACKQYLEENYRKTIAPLLQVREGSNKKTWTHESAMQNEMERLKKMYLK